MSANNNLKYRQEIVIECVWSDRDSGLRQIHILNRYLQGKASYEYKYNPNSEVESRKI